MQDITGQKFNRLTAVCFSHFKNGKYYWKFKCDCGCETIAEIYKVKSGHTQSCGCYHKDIIRTIYGLRKHRLYGVWVNIKERCLKPRNKAYKNYGGRGIKICENWSKNFLNFYDWAMANGYAESLSIDRIDVNGDYCPENCRWATPKQQARNKRDSKMVVFNGVEKHWMDWCEELGLSKSAVGHCKQRTNMEYQEIFERYIKKKNRTKTDGKIRKLDKMNFPIKEWLQQNLSKAEIARRCGVDRATIRKYIA